MNLYDLVNYLKRVEYGNSSLTTHRIAKLSVAEQQAIEIGGGGGYAVLTSANDTETLDLSVSTYFCNLNYGDYISVNVPVPSTSNAGNPITFVRSDSDGGGESQISINIQMIDGSNFVLSNSQQYVTFVNDSNNWFIVSESN